MRCIACFGRRGGGALGSYSPDFLRLNTGSQKLFGGLSAATPVSTRSLRSQRCDFADLV